MRDLIRMIVVLTAISVSSALVLAYANKLTEAPREYQLLKYVEAPSIKKVLVGYDNDPIKDRIVMKMGVDKKGRPIIMNIFPGKKEGKIIGLAYAAAGMGHEGFINVMVGVDLEGKITGLGIMTHSETPGLGARIEEPAFTDQFKGITPSDDVELSSNGGDIDSVSGATHSSEGVIKAVKKALKEFPAVVKEVG